MHIGVVVVEVVQELFVIPTLVATTPLLVLVCLTYSYLLLEFQRRNQVNVSEPKKHNQKGHGSQKNVVGRQGNQKETRTESDRRVVSQFIQLVSISFFKGNTHKNYTGDQCSPYT